MRQLMAPSPVEPPALIAPALVEPALVEPVETPAVSTTSRSCTRRAVNAAASTTPRRPRSGAGRLHSCVAIAGHAASSSVIVNCTQYRHGPAPGSTNGPTVTPVSPMTTGR